MPVARLRKLLPIGILVVGFVLGLYFYPQLPAHVASHWDANGKVNGYVSRFWGAFLMPVIGLGMYLLLLVLPKIDPKRKNISEFRPYYDWFVVVVLGLLLYVDVLSLMWNVGSRFNIGQVMAPAMAALFFYAGVMTGHAKQNYLIGIRTPWTLANEQVWAKTHRFGAKLIKIAALITLFGAVFPSVALALVIVPIFVAALASVAYSYVEFRHMEA